MQDYIVAGILLIVVGVAVFRAVKHFKGGGCCGSGSVTIRDKKVLTAPKLGEMVLTIEGMHCENCAIRIENALNRLDGVLCKVNHRRKIATVSYSAKPSQAQLIDTVEQLGYHVTAVQDSTKTY